MTTMSNHLQTIKTLIAAATFYGAGALLGGPLVNSDAPMAVEEHECDQYESSWTDIVHAQEDMFIPE